MAYFHLLGTGPSTPITEAEGRNRRLRSSGLMQHIATYLLIDATHDFDEQVEEAMSVTHVVVTNASRDAAGGLANLDRWAELPIPFYVPRGLWDEIHERYGPFRQLEPQPIDPHAWLEVGDLHMLAFPLETSSGSEARATYGYHFDTTRKRVTYASDVKHIPEESERYFHDNDLLVVDAAGWDKDLPTHRGALNHLPDYVSRNNEQILFTDVGRSAPPHARASGLVRRMDHRADVAFDFMKVPLGR